MRAQRPAGRVPHASPTGKDNGFGKGNGLMDGWVEKE
jgi:hypothetical protein